MQYMLHCTYIPADPDTSIQIQSQLLAIHYRQICRTGLTDPPLRINAHRSEIRAHNPLQILLTKPHMLALQQIKNQPSLLRQPPQPQPILLVYIPLRQRRHHSTRLIILCKPRGLLRHHRLIIRKHIHDKLIQPGNIIRVGRILNTPLIIHIGQEIAELEVLGQIVRVPEVLRRDQPSLHELRPRAELEQRIGALADQIGGVGTGLEVADAVVLAAEGDEVVDGGVVAALDVGAEELAALAEAERVDGRGGAEDVVARELSAGVVELFGEVAEEGGAPVGGARVAELDDLHVGAFVDGGGECGRGFDAVGVVGVA